MNISCKFNPKLLAAFLPSAMLLIVTFSASGNYENKKLFYNSLTAYQDTTRPVSKDSIRKRDTIPRSRTDTIDLRISKDSLDAPVNYTASDSVVLDVPTKKIRLFNKANTKYKDLDLSGYFITLDQPKKLIIATYTKD